MRPHRITFVNPCGEVGGAERALLLLLRGLDRSRYAPTVVCSAEGRFTQALSRDEVPYVVAPLGGVDQISRFGKLGPARLASSGAAAAGALSSLVRTLRPLRPDLIHTNGIKAHLLGGMAGRLLRRPVLWHMRDLFPEGRARTVFRAASGRLPRRIITVSNAVTEQFQGSGGAGSVRTVHDALDPAQAETRLERAAVRAEWRFPEEAVVLAMVAHFTRWKGHDVFLDTLARVRAAGVPAYGLIVGGSIYASAVHAGFEGEVRERAKELGLAEYVRFTGYREDTPDLIHAADLLVHPPTRPEPFGLSVIEAMALGRPVVASGAGGIRETVAHGETGLLATPGEADGFARAVLELAQDPARRERMGLAGRERVARLFSPERHHAAIRAVYEELLTA